MLAGSEFQSLGRAIVKEDEYEEVRWDGIVSIVSWRERVFRLWWEERRTRHGQHVDTTTESSVSLWLAEEKSVTRVQRRVRHTWIGGSEDEDQLPGQSGTLTENYNFKSYRVCVHSMWISGVLSAHSSYADKKGKIETVSGEVPGWLFNDAVSTRGYLESMRLVIARWYLARSDRGFIIDYLAFTLWLGKTSEKTQPASQYVLVGRPEEKRPLGRPRRRWEDNIKMDLREMGYNDRDCINLAQDRDRWRAYVRAAINLRVP
ncbi:hypothetical protein ANN_23106 [Periplaneta americana]|uniref:Uncharacterized protein n=1 Tax=Periplaneta americana TaxID=6978 RepID=A0ABQ8SK60_PERAM|nr:hypothetical protein ANN_23106 [Periplaneta americana]